MILSYSYIPFLGFLQVLEVPFVSTDPQSSGIRDLDSCSIMSCWLESAQGWLQPGSAFGEG